MPEQDMTQVAAAGAPGPGAGLGEAVREAREAAGLSVEQISARTKIRTVVLRDLEAGSTARSGGAAYARGHLRAIAVATGADADVLLRAHDRLAQGPLVPEPAAAQVPRVPLVPLTLPAPARERGGPRWGVAGLAAALVLSVLLLAGIWSGRDASTPAQPPVAAAPVTPAPTPTATVAPPVPTPAPTGAALRLKVSGDDSWVTVLTASGATLFKGVLTAGAAREWNDPARLQVLVGNAGAVTVGCGGKDVAAGRSGQVRRFTCASDGLVPA